MSRRSLVDGVLVIVLLWAGAAFATEMRRASWLLENDPWVDSRPSTWRPGCAAAKRFTEFAALLSEHVDPGQRVLFVGPGPASEDEVRALWLAHVQPALNVVPLLRADQVERGELIVSYGEVQGRRAGLHFLYEIPGGALYLAP